MSKIKYRNGSKVETLLDTDEIERDRAAIAALPRLPIRGYQSSPWPYGIVCWNVSEDKRLFHLHGNIFFESCASAWANMVSIPGRPSNERALKVPLPLATQTVAKRLPGCGFTTTVNPITSWNMHRDELIVGTDGNIYLYPTTSQPSGDNAFGLWVSVWYCNVDDLEAA